jgi:hypothetical protein
VQVAVPPNAIPGKYAIEVGLYPVGKPGERLTVVESGEDRAILDHIKVGPKERVTYTPQTRLNANFGGKALLSGYDAYWDQDALTLALYWQALAPFERDYQVFAHLVDPEGTILAQVDRPPQEGNYPTSIWEPGEQIRDVYTLAAPSSASRGALRVKLGLYRTDTMERLPVHLDGRGSDHVEILVPNP